MISKDMLAGTFRMAASQHFALSPLYSFLAVRAAEDENVLRVAEASNPGQFPPHLLFSAVHSLLLESADAELAKFYPSITGKALQVGAAYSAFRAFVLERSEAITTIIRSAHVNKSVPMRSACLWALLTKVATENKWNRVHLVDIGCGAGFNLLMDHWRMTYKGAKDVGPADSPVHFSIELRGGSNPPLDGMPEILSRTGIDLDCFNFSDVAQERWILGNLFPDHLEAFTITKNALGVLRRHPPRLVCGDAGALLATLLQELPGVEPVVVMHSLMLPQMKPQQKQGIAMAIRQTSAIRPIARIGMELSNDKSTAVLSSAISGEAEAIVAGAADPDGAWMHWN
jgi:hypothetical protein